MSEQVEQTFREQFEVELVHVKAEDRFLDALDDVIDVISKAVVTAAEAVRGAPVPPIERMTWLDAMERYFAAAHTAAAGAAQ